MRGFPISIAEVAGSGWPPVLVNQARCSNSRSLAPITPAARSASSRVSISSMSSMVTMPTSRPSSSVITRRRRRLLRISRTASMASISGLAVTSGADMMSPAVNIAGSSPSAISASTRSRSVTMPSGLTFSSASTTISAPTWCFRISWAAASAVVSGSATATMTVAKSLKRVGM